MLFVVGGVGGILGVLFGGVDGDVGIYIVEVWVVVSIIDKIYI